VERDEGERGRERRGERRGKWEVEEKKRGGRRRTVRAKEDRE